MSTRYIDALDVTIADSFVVPSNKVESGHGEAKLYVGHRTSDNYREFFGLRIDHESIRYSLGRNLVV